ncbi:uncharacterized protein LOC128879970 [Hylaeus volcanicus]|uniref:uncharacterized protein LOC128879970 n=1 Tax=Hylaeus volcanicus TaxID=313075 RepID=UPI0023B7FD18|nr:uncharacterized protein LOC128879970 [Hylaeus volcanicus]
MADDPNRDILPVREGSCADTCRSNIDPRERHFVYKLDRYQLEDKYLRLLEEASELKKLSNCQEDKIKRLATKLMRVTANPRNCTVALDVYEDKNKIIALELENSKLKDKISVLRNQLLSHAVTGRSSSRSRNPQTRPSSGRITCRSENSRTKIPSCHCIVETVNDDYEARSKIQELEAQKKEMSCRIAQLEKELSAYTVTARREKVAENIEYIKCWRQMKQLNDKLIVARNTNESLNAQINGLNRMLEETTKNNQETTKALLAEKRRLSEIEKQMLTTKDSQFSLKEKDEQIKDLVNELKILQQHNSELIALSSKKGDVESENLELKRTVNEQRHDREALKTAFNAEQTNIVALQISNEQLLEKLDELQKNMDSLMVQLTSFQTHSQTEKQETSKATQISTKQPDKKLSTTTDRYQRKESNADLVTTCRKCCEESKNIVRLEETIYVTRGLQASKPIDQSVQTEYAVELITVNTKDQVTSAMTPGIEEKSQDEPREKLVIQEKTERTISKENPLTPEKMLKLLEQAQINTPLDAARFAYKDVANDVDYNDILDLNQRHRQVVSLEKLLFETFSRALKESPAFQRESRQEKNEKYPSSADRLEYQPPDTDKFLSLLFNVLQEYCISGTMPEGANLYRPTTVEHQFSNDTNNSIGERIGRGSKKCLNVALKDQHATSNSLNIEALNETKRVLRTTTSLIGSGCAIKKSCSNINNKPRQEKMRRKMFPNVKWRNQITRFSETRDCNCNDTIRCNFSSDCDYRCCNDGHRKSHAASTADNRNSQRKLRSMTINNVPENVQTDTFNSFGHSCIQDGLGTMYITRKLLDENEAGPYRSWERNKRFPKTKNDSDDDKSLREYVNQLNKCRELLDNDCSLNNAVGISSVKEIIDDAKSRKAESFCSVNCPNECADVSSSASDSFPLVITDGQGLMELHILSLQLSTSAKQILFRESNLENVSLFVSWDIWNQETAYTPTLKCSKLNFNSSFVYRIPDLHSFFNYVLLEFVMFQVNVYHEDNDSYVVAAGKLCIKDILDYPQNKLHYIAPVNGVIPCSLGTTFGQLSLWVRLSCDLEKVEAFKRKRNLNGQPEYHRVIGENVPEAVEPPWKHDAAAAAAAPSKNGLYVLKEGGADKHLAYELSKDDIFLQSSMPFETSKGEQSVFGKLAVNGDSESAGADDDILTVMKVTDTDLRLSNPYEQSMKAEQVLENDPDILDDRHRYRHHHRLQEKEQPEPPINDVNKETETRAESLSIAEFNADIANNVRDRLLTQNNSNESFQEVTNVFSQKNWDKYKRKSILAFTTAFRPNSKENQNNYDSETSNDGSIEKDTIAIEIVNIILFPKSFVMEDEDIQLLYVEFSFLGYCGSDMETISVQKPTSPDQKLTFNFRKKFQVDEKRHAVQDNILRAMLNESTNPSIRFIVVSEPLPEEDDTKECVEIGYANFNLREYALGDSEKIVTLPIYGIKEKEKIGLLKISVIGLDTIRQRLGKRQSSL